MEKPFVKNERNDSQSCVKSAMLNASETWCLREKDMAIRETEKKQYKRIE